VDNPDMFLHVTQGIDLPKQSVSTDRHKISVRDRPLSTGTEPREGTGNNFDMTGLRSRNQQMMVKGWLPIVLLTIIFLLHGPGIAIFSQSYTQHSACGQTEVQLG
jgi:hypothetical protein